MKKDIKKTIRFNQEELEIINKKMAQLDIDSHSQYIREMAMYGFMVIRDSTQLDQLLEEYSLLRYELKSIGININQIARRLNSSKSVYKDDVEEIKNNIEKIYIKIETSLDKVVKQY